MDKQKRFYISRDGKALTDRKKNSTVAIEKFRVIQSGKIEVVLFNENVEGKTEQRVARYKIDEKDFTLGEAQVETTTRRHKLPPKQADPPPSAGRGRWKTHRLHQGRIAGASRAASERGKSHAAKTRRTHQSARLMQGPSSTTLGRRRLS